MSRQYLKFLWLFLIIVDSLWAKDSIDCRVMTGNMTECNPYGQRLHHVEEISYKKDRHKLILVKKLLSDQKKRFMKVISVKDMMTEYVYVKDFIYVGQDDIVPPKESIESKIVEKIPQKKSVIKSGYYVIVKGDSLSKVAKKLALNILVLKKLNHLKHTSTLSIGQKLKTPFDQKTVDALLVAKYTVKKGDTLLSISKMFQLPAKDIVTFNHIKNATMVREGKVLNLPLPYILDRLEARDDALNINRGYKLDINAFGTEKLRVTATAYTSHGNQTDDTPFLAAWNNTLRPGMKIIAVSRDLLTRYGMRNGTRVRIAGLKGYYRVRDKMNKRYKKRIDIYMGLDLKNAFKWGKRSVVIYW